MNQENYFGLGLLTLILFDTWLILQIFGLGHIHV